MIPISQKCPSNLLAQTEPDPNSAKCKTSSHLPPRLCPICKIRLPANEGAI